MSAVDYRRALHRIPELDNQLPETVQLVQRILAPLPCRVFSPITGSVCAWFDAGKSDAVAFRAELDALPVTEATDLPYASVHPGRMHACGHDAHTAMVLTLAEYAAEHLAELPRNVLFLFQPSEETTGGAGNCGERRAGALPGPPDLRPAPVARPGGRDHRLPPRPADGTVQRGHRHRGRPQRPHVPGGRGAGRPDGGHLLPPAGL
ncbi:MAG: M20/M25/M40 family metallo-hydrolase [Dysosmobacter welbionis]